MANSIQSTFLAGAVLFSAGLAPAQDDKATHESPPRLIEVGGNDMGAVIDQVARASGRPFGWVVASNDLKPCFVAKMKVVEGGDPTDALRSITAQCPAYTLLQDQMGMVVEPVQPLKSILELPVHDFSLTDATSFAAEYAVWRLPEVRHWLELNHLGLFDVEPGDKWRGDTTRFSIDLHDVTLREVLNDLAVKSKRMVWKVVWFDRDTSLGIFL